MSVTICFLFDNFIVAYEKNRKAWITSEFFGNFAENSWQAHTDTGFFFLFTDNCRAHNTVPKLDYGKIVYLTSKTIS